MGIGVTTGKNYCGSVGNISRREYAVVGDSVNRAARLMLVEGVTTLVDLATYTATVNGFEFKERELLKVKGDTEKMHVYEPIRPAQQSHPGIIDSMRIDFSGRPHEKKKMIDCLYKKSIVYISGPEGYGKSRFLAYTSACAEKLGFPTFSTTGSQPRKGIAYFAVGELIKQILRLNTETYETLDMHGKYLYIERQLEMVVDNFLAPLKTLFGGQKSQNNMTVSGMLTRDFRRDSEASDSSWNSRRMSGISLRSHLSGVSSAAAKILSIGESYENEDQEGSEQASSANVTVSGRADLGTQKRHNSFRESREGGSPVSRMRSNSVFSIGRASSTTSISSFLTSSSKDLDNNGVSQNGSVLQSSLDRHTRPRLFTNPTDLGTMDGRSFFVGGFGSAKVEPMTLDRGREDDDNEGDDASIGASSAAFSEAPTIGTITSFNGLGGDNKKKKYYQLSVGDFLSLIQATIDIGVTAPLTPAIRDMSSIMRATTLDKLFYYILSAQRNSVIIIDNAEHLDANSWALMERLARRSRASSIFFSGKKNLMERAPSLKRALSSSKAEVIELSPLDNQSLGVMISNKCKGGKWPKRLIQMILDNTLGVPEQCAKVIETLLRAKLIEVVKEAKDGEETVLRFAEDSTILHCITSFAQGAETRMVEQFDNLDKMCQVMIQIASVFGSFFTVEMITELLPFVHRKDNEKIKMAFITLCSKDWFQPDNATERKKLSIVADNFSFQPKRDSDKRRSSSTRNNDLVDLFEGFLRRKGTKTFSFSDERTRLMAYGTITVTERMKLHHEAAECITNTWFDDLQAVFPMIAMHYKEAHSPEDEIKALQMAAAGFVRTGHLRQAVLSYRRMLVLSKSVNFTKFEHFDKGETLADWNLTLAQCEYMQGNFGGVKTALNSSLQWLQISGKKKVTLNSALGAKELNKIFVHLGKEVFMKSPPAKVNLKGDKLNTTAIKTLGFLLLVSILDSDQENLVLYGVHLLKELIDAQSPQGTYAAIVVCKVLKRFASGWMGNKACNYICSKADVLFNNQKWYKEGSLASLCLLSSLEHYGSKIKKSKDLANEVLDKLQNMGSVIGHMEALMLVTSGEIMIGDNTAADVHCVAFKSMTSSLHNNPIALVWESACRCRKFHVGSMLLEADEYEEVKKALKAVRKITKKRGGGGETDDETLTGRPEDDLGDSQMDSSQRDSSSGRGPSYTALQPFDNLPKTVQVQALLVESACVLILGMSEADFWTVSFESCSQAVEIMEQCHFLSPCCLDSFFGIACIPLYLLREASSPESTGNGEGEKEATKKDTVAIYKRALVCCNKVVKECNGSLKPFLTSLEEVDKLLDGKTSVAAARTKLLKCKSELESKCSYYWSIVDNVEGELEMWVN